MTLARFILTFLLVIALTMLILALVGPPIASVNGFSLLNAVVSSDGSATARLGLFGACISSSNGQQCGVWDQAISAINAQAASQLHTNLLSGGSLWPSLSMTTTLGAVFCLLSLIVSLIPTWQAGAVSSCLTIVAAFLTAAAQALSIIFVARSRARIDALLGASSAATVGLATVFLALAAIFLVIAMLVAIFAWHREQLERVKAAHAQQLAQQAAQTQQEVDYDLTLKRWSRHTDEESLLSR